MVFAEFIEAIVRIAIKKWPSDEVSTLDKIERTVSKIYSAKS